MLIWLFALFVIAVSWAAPLQRLREDRNEIVAAAVRENQNRATLLEQYVARTLEAADIATLHIAERYRSGDPALRGTPERPATIRGPVAANHAFLGLSIANADGDIIASTMGPRVAGRNVRNHEAFRAHLGRDTGRLHVSRPAASRTYGQEIIWLTRRLNAGDGAFAGVVAINIEPQQLIGFHAAVSTRPRDVVSVIGLDGVTRARRTGDIFSSGEDLANGLVMRRQRADPDGTYLGPSALDGLVRYFSHRRLDDYPLFATYGVMEQDVLAPVTERRRYVIAGSILVTLVTLTFVFGLLSLLRRTEERATQLASANQRLSEAQRIGQIGDWAFSLADGKLSWSPQLYETYRRDPADGPPTMDQFKSWLDEESRAAIDEAIAAAVETGEAQSYALGVLLPDGSESHRLIAALPTRDADGRVVGLHGTDQDVTARRELDRLQVEVSHLSRLAAMNAMAATLAHELNQPLAAASNYIVGSRRLLAAGGPQAAQAAVGMLAAQEQVQFAGEIIRRVRAMVSNEPKSMSPAAMARVIDDAIALGIPARERETLDVVTGIAPDARFMLGDPVQIQQVLLNLIRNAVEAAAAADRPRVALSVSRYDDAHLLVTVEDNGEGLREIGAPLFTAFVSDKITGMGLGLSISRTIIESHGGRIWAESLPEGGARFSFTVPAADLEGE